MPLGFRTRAVCLALLALASSGAPARAITLQIDYRYDTHGFFNPATTNGQKARTTVDAAAAFFSGVINDSLSPIGVPPSGNIWRQIITHPGTGQANYEISSAASFTQEAAAGWQPADEYRNISVPSSVMLIYAGATDLAGLGVGGTAYASYGTSNFNSLIAQRGKPLNEYASWGGFVSFDNVGPTWHLDHTQPVPAGRSDLYSTALHEIAHVLGLCTDNHAWNQWQSGNLFRGPEATAAWKADDPSAPASATGVPTVGAGDVHWRDNVGGAPSVRSKILGTNTLQEAAMDPTLLAGRRKLMTNVDVRALRDVGWTVPSSVFDVPVTQPADFNGDGLVNGADLGMWRTAFGATAAADADSDGDSDGHDFLVWQRQRGAAAAGVPEPTAAALGAATWATLVTLRRRRRWPSQRRRRP